jgi:phospholipid/cholesterol/gamma-HCH transport system substrate-binding protein
MENKAHALAAGAFVLILGATLIALAIWLTRDGGVRHVYELSTREAVSGLVAQAAVRYRGIDVGKVVKIGFDPQTTGNVLVRIAVDDAAPITRSTFATLGYQGVTGLAYVQLDDDGESNERLAGDAAHPPRIPMRPGLISRLTDEGGAIMAQAKETLVRAQETIARVTELLSPENRTALLATIDALGDAASGINKAAGNVDTMAAEARHTLRMLEATSTEISKTAAAATTSAVDFSRTMRSISDNFGGATEALTSSAYTFNRATLPRVHRVTEDTRTTLRRAARVFEAVNDNPQSLIYGGGEVRPGPGEPGFVAPGRSQ